jgi:hypothetical protein
MTMTRDDVDLYVMGQYDGDVAALERAIAGDPDLAEAVAEASRLELLLRDAGAEATFCIGCHDLVRGERCDACGAAVRPGGYQIERMLVANAHGRMYVARDVDGKQVALKELAFVHVPSAEALAAFERESKLLRALAHPSIPRFVASFEEGTGVHLRYYLAQELVEGTPLDRLEGQWYSEAEVVRIGAQVLASLVYLQGLSPMVVHRDVKPANLLRRADGTIALVDFGAAHVQGTTAGSTTIGTFGYMPVEQLAGEVDATTDVYALGMSLVHLLTRQEPWRIAQSRTTINASAPMRELLDRMTAPSPRDRFPSAEAALEALEALGTPRASRPQRRRWRVRRAALAAAVMVALGASGVGVYELTRSHAPVAPPPARVELPNPPFASEPAGPVNAAMARLKHGVSPLVVREQLRRVPATDSDYPYALYWIAVLSLRDLEDWDAARTALGTLVPMHTPSRWLRPWTLVRQAQVAEHDSDPDAATLLWAEAKAAVEATGYNDDELDYYLGSASQKYDLVP